MSNRKLSAHTAILGSAINPAADYIEILDVSDSTDAASGTNKKMLASGLIAAAGLTPTVTELNFVDGVTSAIQTQLDGKQASGTYLTSANIVETITNGVTTKSPSENAVFDALALKQDVLVSATNIKTINSTSLLGSGDIVISSGLTVGTTAIASGATTRILYDNAGTLGEYTITGSGTVVAMATSPAFITPVLGAATGTSLGLGGAVVGTLSAVVAPPAVTTNGVLNLGNGGFGGSAGHFSGNSLGTGLAMNFVSGYAGDLMNLQVNGVSKFKMSNDATIDINHTVDGGLIFYNINSSTGANANTTFLFGQSKTGGTYGYFEYDGSGYSGTGIRQANRLIVTGASTGGLALGATNTSGIINFYTGGLSSTELRGTINAVGTWAITPATLTGSQATSALDISQTWNTTGAPTAIKLNVTNTTSGASSQYFDIQKDGVSQLNFNKNNQLVFRTNGGGGIGLGGGGLTFAGGTIPTSSTIYVGPYGIDFLTENQSVSNSSLLRLGGINQAGTSGTVDFFKITNGIAAAAGSANFRGISFNGTINNSGAQLGTFTDIFSNTTETALNSMTHNLMDLQVGSASRIRGDNVGNLFLGASTIGTSGTNTFATKIGTSPTTAPADTIQIFAKDSSAGSANATLGFYLEQAPESGIAVASTHKQRVWINGTEYFFLLTAV